MPAQKFEDIIKEKRGLGIDNGINKGEMLYANESKRLLYGSGR